MVNYGNSFLIISSGNVKKSQIVNCPFSILNYNCYLCTRKTKKSA